MANSSMANTSRNRQPRGEVIILFPRCLVKIVIFPITYAWFLILMRLGFALVMYFQMSYLIKGRYSDWFPIVLDYIGFAPARFYLRESCKALHAAIPPEVYLSMGEFVAALREKLVNPRILFLAPNAYPDEDSFDGFLSYSRFRLDLMTLLLERTFMQWDNERVVELIPDYLTSVETHAWKIGAQAVMEKAKECKRLAGIVDSPRSSYEFRYCCPREGESDLLFCKRFLNEWARPEDGEAWQALLSEALDFNRDKEAIDYLLAEGGRAALGNEDFMEHIARTDYVDVMEEHLARMNEELAREEAPGAIREAGAHSKKLMFQYLVDLFGIETNICTVLTDINIIDFALSRGADINSNYTGAMGTMVGANSETCLGLALWRGQLELVGPIVARGGRIESVSVVFGSPQLTREVLRKQVLACGLLDGRIDADLFFSAVNLSRSAEVIEEVFDLVYGEDPSIVPDAFDSTLFRYGNSEFFPDFVPFLKRLIEIDPSLVHQAQEEGVLPIGVCALFKPFSRRQWTGELIYEWRRPTLRYFLEQGKQQCYREKVIVADWYATSIDQKYVEAVDDFKKCLIDHGADTELWFTPDCVAKVLESGASMTKETIQLLVTFGADLNVGSGGWGVTPLMRAIMENDGNGLLEERVLIECRADVNARDTIGRTALFYAVLAGSIGQVALLLANGADVDLTDHAGTSSVDLAQFIHKFREESSWGRKPLKVGFEDNVFLCPGRANRAAIFHRLTKMSKSVSPRASRLTDIEFAERYDMFTIAEFLKDEGHEA